MGPGGTAGPTPYDLKVDTSEPDAADVAPPLVGPPFRLRPFRGMMLTGRSVGDADSFRAFSRPYRDVARRLARWEKSGRLAHDDEPALYLHEYTVNGITVRGLIGALELSRRAGPGEPPAVLPHEAIHPRQARELADRMREMEINPAPVLLVHRGPAAVREIVCEVAAGEPLRIYHDRHGQTQRIWALRDPERLARVHDALADAQVLLADGHHRYAAYLEVQEERPGTAWDRGLAMLVDQDDTPIFLGAIHRILHRTSLADVRRAVEDLPGATWEPSAETAAISALAADTLVLTDGEAWATLRLEPGPRAPVELLHQDLLPRLRGAATPVTYHHSVQDLLRDLVTWRDVAVLLPAPDFDTVIATVARRRLLPEKATSFQPKPTVGVLMRSLRDR